MVKSIKIGKVEIPNNIFLAPMAGVTDMPFRLLCKEQGCGLTYTEMVSSKGILYNNSNTKNLLCTYDAERPIAAQLFGGDPKILAEAAMMINDLDINLIDINMGCPAPKIVKNGEGSALLRNPRLIGEIVGAVSKATDKPVTIKMRTGFNGQDVNAALIAAIAEENGASAIAVHGRTRDQFYSGSVDFETIRKVKEAVKIPVIGNGDINSPETAKAMFEKTGCDGIMIGRGACGNPWIFSATLKYLKTGDFSPMPSSGEKLRAAIRHAKMLIEYKGEYIGVREARKHLAWYTKGIKGSSEVRGRIFNAESLKEFEMILQHE